MRSLKTHSRLMIVAVSAAGVLFSYWALAQGSHLGVPHQGDQIECGPTPNQAELRGLLAELMRAWVPARNEPAALPNADSQGAKLLGRYCAQCHGLPDPKAYSVDEWSRVMDRMSLRMKAVGNRRCHMLQLSVPTDQERGELLGYLRESAFEPLNAGPKVPLVGKGAEAYLNFCSQCHDLPHPRQHLPAEWSKVVDRMQNYAYFIGRRTITDTENTAIVDFLKSQAQ
jgi:cytochrome c5